MTDTPICTLPHPKCFQVAFQLLQVCVWHRVDQGLERSSLFKVGTELGHRLQGLALAGKKAQVAQSVTGGVGLDLYLPTAQSAESACRLLTDPAHAFGKALLDLCSVPWIRT